MKRSEMLIKLEEQIDVMRGVAQQSNGEPFYVYPDDETMAKMILQVIEEAGMLPPFAFIQEDNLTYIRINEWEAENE